MMNLEELETTTIEEALEDASLLLEDMLAERDLLLTKLGVSEKEKMLTMLRDFFDCLVTFPTEKTWLAAAKAVYWVVENTATWQPELLPKVPESKQMKVTEQADQIARTQEEKTKFRQEQIAGFYNRLHQFVHNKPPEQPPPHLSESKSSDEGQSKIRQLLNNFFGRS